MPAKSGKQYRLMQLSKNSKVDNPMLPSKSVAEKFIRETPKKKRSMFMKKQG
jgi:hypothetical protein